MRKGFGIIGVGGYIAPRHLKAVLDTGNNVFVTYDKSDSVGTIDSFFPASEFFTEFEVFLDYCYHLQRNGKNLEYISVCSPNYLHESHCSAALRLGCNVICEKPLVPDLAAIDRLVEIEKETGKKVFNILQLRHHSSILELKKDFGHLSSSGKTEVELTYITSRGRWYHESWKGDQKKSFGIATNIGIHFFDMLAYIFGDLISSEVFMLDDNRASGYLEYERAKVKWFLSIDYGDLPKDIDHAKTTFRQIKCDGQEIEFSGGFTDLHTVSYRKILDGFGFGLNDARSCVAAAEMIRTQNLTELDCEKSHPFLLGHSGRGFV